MNDEKNVDTYPFQMVGGLDSYAEKLRSSFPLYFLTGTYPWRWNGHEMTREPQQDYYWNYRGALRRWIDSEPKNEKAWTHRGMTCANAGELENAYGMFVHALELAEKDGIMEVAVGRAWNNIKVVEMMQSPWLDKLGCTSNDEKHDIEKGFDLALHRFTNNSVERGIVLYNSAVFKAKSGSFESALSMFADAKREAAALESKNGRALFSICKRGEVLTKDLEALVKSGLFDVNEPPLNTNPPEPANK